MNSSERENAAVEVMRCRDPERIAAILRRDYFDDPLPRLGAAIVHTFARDWVARRREVYMHVAEASGAYAGFVFGHTLGPRLWRLFAREHPRHLPSLISAAAKMRLAGETAGASSRPGASNANNGKLDADKLEAEIGALGIERLPRAFAWSNAGTGIIPLVFVGPDFRGRGVARRLLDSIVAEMFADGATAVEAHIDLHNLSSARAFLKAGFEVYRMSSEEFWARKSYQEGRE